MYDVISVGSALIDIFVETGDQLFQKVKRVNNQEVVHVPFGSKIRIANVKILTGGGGSNTAVAFAKAGLFAGYLLLLFHY